MKKTVLFETVTACTGALLLGGSVFFAANSNNVLNIPHLNATGNAIVLDRKNSPNLSNGSGTIIDAKGVTWEYYNASDYSAGHITLNNGGYVGIASSSAYGYTGINELVADFSAASGDELWLLKSTDGIDWHEDKILEDEISITSANNWRYVRFYNYSPNANSINIDSVSISFSCAGISATEDIDGAKSSNVIATSSNLSYESEYAEVSPRSVGGEAVKFSKTTTSGSTNLIIGFGNTYKIGDIQNAKIEFDMKTSNINYGKTVQLMKDNTSFGSAVESSKTNSYKCTNIQDDWYHIEVPITTFVSTISGYKNKDLPATNVENKEINAIKINAGNCIIDNLRIGSSPCELGIFNSPTYKPTVGEIFWLKVSWVGKLFPENVTMNFSDNSMVRRIPLDDPNLKHGSPFYIELLSSGTLTITCNVTCGYNRQVHTIQHTLVIN